MQVQSQNLIFEAGATPQVSGGNSPPSVRQNFTIDLSSTDTDVRLIWTNPNSATTIEVWKSVNGGAYALYDTIPGASTDYHDLAGMPALDYWEYKVLAVNGFGFLAFTTPAGVDNGLNDAVTVNISYPNLVLDLAGIFFGSNNAVITASFPRLAKAVSISFFDATSLTTVDFTSLQTITFNLAGSGCAVLGPVSFPALVSVINFGLTACDVMTSLTAPNLTTVGMFNVTGSGLTSLTLPALSLVSSDMYIGVTPATSLNFPVLATVVGAIDFANSNNLATVDFSALTTVGFLQFFTCPQLQTLYFPVLTSTGGITGNGCDALTSATFPVLTFVGGSVVLSDSFSLLTIDFGVLDTVGSDLQIENCPVLMAADFPALVTVNGELSVSGNTNMGSFITPVLTGVGTNLRVTNCGSLVTMDFNAFNSASGLISFAFSFGVASVDINFPALTFVGDDISFEGCAIVQNIYLPLLTFARSAIFLGCNSLLTVDLTSLVSITGGDLDFRDCVSLTALSFPAMTDVFDIFTMSNCVSVVTLSAPVLVTTEAFFVEGCVALTTVTLPNFQGTTADNLSFEASSSLVTLNFPALTTVGAEFNFNGCSSLATLTIPVLFAVASRFKIVGTVLTTLSAPNLDSINAGLGSPDDAAIDASGVTTLVSVSFPLLSTFGHNVLFSGCSSLVNVDFGANATFSDGWQISFSDCALSTTSVDYLLAQGVFSGTSTSDYQFAGGTNSSPTGGVLNPDYIALVGAGNTVAIN